MNAPNDFGLDPRETLSHVGDRTPARGHGPFWQRWADSVWAAEPRLAPIKPGGVEAEESGDPGVNRWLESRRHVRIGGRLIPPGQGATRSVVLLLHGYQGDARLDDASAWRDEEGVAVFKLRVRGYPGSWFDTGDLYSHPGGWITCGLDAGADWILFDAVADVVNAFRALRAHYGAETPISIAGESFGGGLAVMAAAQISGRDRLFRMVIGLPTFGDWVWRMDRAPAISAGAGAEVAAFVRQHESLRDRIMETLRLSDTVVHAPRSVCPALCKLACRDDVVPAPTAAGVFNALGSSPRMKWRFLTRYGHFDGGVSDARRHALFERLAGRFLDPREDLLRLMDDWTPKLTDLSRDENDND